MRVLFVSSEIYPLAKTGGLADVSAALPLALAGLCVDVRLLLPAYPQALEAARTMQPLWSQPDARPPRFEDSLDRAKSRFAGILTDLGLETPKELNQ